FLPFRPPGLLATQISPTAVAFTTGQPWLFHSSRTCVVTFTGIEYANRPNQAIDGRGLSPHKTPSLVGCSTARPPRTAHGRGCPGRKHASLCAAAQFASSHGEV